MVSMKISLGFVILLGVALGYPLGTGSDRDRQKVLMVKLGRRDGEIIAAPSDADSTDASV